MAQRSWDVLRSFEPAERDIVSKALAGTGCEALLAYSPRHRLVKRDFKLHFEAGPDGTGGEARRAR
jgi:hypothetical protein